LYFWKFIHSFSSLFSSYYYIYVAAFIEIVPYDGYWVVDIVFMSIFLASILIEFITEYIPKGSDKPERSFEKIALNYFKNGFIIDFLATFPFEKCVNI